MRRIDVGEVESGDVYRLLTSVVVPRPIAWVSSVSREGVPNLAPFSYFNAITSRPPLVSVAVGRRRGRRKDTARNASETGCFVINLVEGAQLDAMVATSGDHPPEVDEFEVAGLTAAAGEVVSAPRVVEARVQLECRTHQIVEVSPGVADLVIGEVVCVHVADEVEVGADLQIATGQLDPVGRLGGSDYLVGGKTVSRERPTV